MSNEINICLFSQRVPIILDNTIWHGYCEPKNPSLTEETFLTNDQLITFYWNVTCKPNYINMCVCVTTDWVRPAAGSWWCHCHTWPGAKMEGWHTLSRLSITSIRMWAGSSFLKACYTAPKCSKRCSRLASHASEETRNDLHPLWLVAVMW